jgi:hypothetical protein
VRFDKPLVATEAPYPKKIRPTLSHSSGEMAEAQPAALKRNSALVTTPAKKVVGRPRGTRTMNVDFSQIESERPREAVKAGKYKPRYGHEIFRSKAATHE